MNRRDALKSLGAIATLGTTLGITKSGAEELKGMPPATGLNPEHVPHPVRTGGGFRFFQSNDDREILAKVMDRLIPHDEFGPSATEAGCLEFLDAQLMGPYGDGADLYLQGPSPKSEKALMGRVVPLKNRRDIYAAGLKALDEYARRTHGVAFSALSPDQIDAILTGLETGKITLGGDIQSQGFFELMLANAREGYLSDPLYGGNRDMAGWKMVGFPGARYDYRQYMDRRGEDLGLEPVSIVPSR